MARYYTITIKHSQGTLIKQFVINAKRLKELVEYVDAMSDKRDPIVDAYKRGYTTGVIDNSINKDTLVNKAREVSFDELLDIYRLQRIERSSIYNLDDAKRE